jgi:hypothetical protein
VYQVGQSSVYNKRRGKKINPLGIEYKGISKVAKLEIKEEVNWNKWIQGN